MGKKRKEKREKKNKRNPLGEKKVGGPIVPANLDGSLISSNSLDLSRRQEKHGGFSIIISSIN